MKKSIIFIISVLFMVEAFAGDILILNNERVFSGKVKRIEECSVVFKANKTRYVVPVSDIHSIQFENPNDKVYRKYMEMGNNDPNKCLSARLDAENYHGKKGGHFVLGVLFGPFAMIGTALANPTPFNSRHTLLMSKNNDMFTDIEYLSCYKRKAKGQLIVAEALGWGAWILFVVATSAGN